MDRMQVVSRRVRLLVPALLVLVTGCGGDGGRAPAPKPDPPAPGLKLVGTAQFSVAVPSGWRVQTRDAKTARPGDKVAEAIGPEGTDGLPPQLVVGATRGYGPGHREQVDVAGIANAQRWPDLRVVSTREVAVKGAAQATLIESEIRNRAPNRPPTRVRIFDLLALSKDRMAVGLFIRVPAADVDGVRVRDILASLEMR